MAESAVAFGIRVARLRAANGWSYRDAGQQCGVAPSTVMRAEKGHDIALSNAVQIAQGLGEALGDMLRPFACGRCHDEPPTGFTCNECGTDG